jgi:hypothetical protein
VIVHRAIALIGALLLACGPSVAPSVSQVPTLAAQTQTPATTAPAPATTSTPAATANPTRAEIHLQFAPGTNIADVDDVYDILTHLKSSAGIHDGFGNELEITVVYDPRQITVEKIRALLEEMGFKTLPPTA